MQEPEPISLAEAMANDAQPYDPTRHLINLNGKGEYLEVKWRILWCKKEHPDASITTEFMNMIDCDLERGPAVFRATIAFDATGGGTLERAASVLESLRKELERPEQPKPAVAEPMKETDRG